MKLNHPEQYIYHLQNVYPAAPFRESILLCLL